MSYIFVDESGDLGFDLSKKGSSRYFVVTFLLIPNDKQKKRLEKIVRKVFRSLKKRRKIKKGVLHCNSETDITRKKLLNEISDEDIRILSICLNKKKVYTNLRNEKVILYNYVMNILLEKLDSKKILPTNSKIELIASRKETNKFLNLNFKNYLESNKSGHKINLKVFIKTPYEDKCLQVADFLSWSIFQKLEHQNNTYTNIFKDKIIEESWLYGK